jgi:PAS domain S-box-containing protein/diguanylate cyclase (GGDEF)-like protein
MQPAVSFMNTLPFKFKIISAISILFLLLILPSRTIFLDYYEKKRVYNSQLIGLSYSVYIQDIIDTVQLHRGLCNGYLHGNEKFKKDILVQEKVIDQKLESLIKYDKRNLKLLKNNKDFVNAISNLTIVKLNALSSNSTSDAIFDIHSDIISQLVETLQEISRLTSFATSDNLQINYIAQLLQEKLLLLQENTGQIRGLAVGSFSHKKISEKQKNDLLFRYTVIKSLETNLVDNKVLVELDDYLSIQKNMVQVISKLDEVLYIIYNNIILKDTPSYDSKQFFKQASFAINEQVKLYKKLSNSYKKLVETLQKDILKNFIYVLIGFFAIIFGSIYLTVAFYHSIVLSLKKLQIASKMIAEGETKIHLKADAKDELGDALLAFNHMSQKLDKNISFLDGYKMAIDETSIVSKTNPKGIITYVNKKFCEISGFSEKELLGMSHNIVRHPEVPKEVFKKLWATIKDGKIWSGVVKNRRKNGDYYIVDATIIPIFDSSNNIIEYIGVRHDITELEKSKEEIKKQKIDLLTGLANRSQLLEDIQVSKKPILLYLNIDDFASLNDFYGGKVGDRVLVYLTSILKGISKDIDCKVYKLHADEFVLLFEEGKLTEQNYHTAMSEIINHIETQTIDCDSKKCVSITLSGGVVFYHSSENFENLLPYANVARKMAKIENKKFLLYRPNMSKESDYKNNIEWINKIKEAISDDRITTYFQPIIDNSTSSITKYESLVRMIDKEGNIISPFFFLDIAKKAKLYTEITKIVIDKTFNTFQNFPKYDFSINITVEDINDNEISSYIYKKLKSFPHPEHVIFEITESEEIKDYQHINQFIKNVKSFGSKIAIDDFGSGYANFEHIISLDADFIKIDGSLIKSIDKNEDSRIITEAIIAFSKKLGSKTVAEFVHNEEIYEKVRSMGADFSQGYYLGEPLSKITDVKEVINDQSV